MKQINLFFIFVLALSLLFIACPKEEPVELPPHVAFFNNLSELCGEKFPGRTDIEVTPDHELAGAEFLMYVETCTEEEIRIPFYVNDDSSRTWVITLSEEGLLLKHDHRHPDGTPEEITMYGGWADDTGTAYLQRFPADEYTAELIPEAATNVWTLEIDHENNQFVYYLERDEQPRIRAVFDLPTVVEEDVEMIEPEELEEEVEEVVEEIS